MLAAIVLAGALLPGIARADAPTILVDGAVVRTDVPPVVVDGHVFVPLRGILERFGATVDYDAAHNVAIARRNGVTVKIAIGTTDAWVGGDRVVMDAAAREFGGRVEVPLRFVAQTLGVAVDYDDATNTVVIVSGFKEGNFVAAGPGTPAAMNLASESSYAAQPSSGVTVSVQQESPSPDSLIGSQYPQIYAQFGGSTVDPATVRITIDSQDVTASATVSSAYVSYTPPAPLNDGDHVVEVSGQSQDGTPFDYQWSFRIDSGVDNGYVSSVIGYGPQAFGYRRFGFHPPGFSVFAPGRQFFVAGEPIVIVFFSPFFQNGSGFFTIAGVPGQFAMTPWLGCPGFFWSSFSVPSGVFSPAAIVAAHFHTSDGRAVLVHSTAPLRIDGTRRSLPADIRFAVQARLVNHAATPRALVAFVGSSIRHSAIVHRNPALRIAGRPQQIEPAQRTPATPIVLHANSMTPYNAPAPVYMPLQHAQPPPSTPVTVPLIHKPPS